jgi:rubrerythrin
LPKEVAMIKTKENLEFAFAGESQANRKYLFFAEKAETKDQKRIARLFRAAAEAETVHARNHLKVLQAIKSTKENLQAAISGENYEFSEMYPQFIKTANSEREKKAADSFDLANKVEKVHHSLYQEALTGLEKGTAKELKPFYVCQVCGNTVEGEAPDKCPICGAPKKMFKLIE